MALGFLAPALERRPRVDARRQPLRVEVGDHRFVDQNVLAPRLVLELRDLVDEPAVVIEECAAGGERAGNERLADEDLARDAGVDAAIRHAAARDEREPVQLHAFARYDLCAFRVPVRLEIFARDAGPRDRLDPFGLDLRRAARVQARGFDELRRQHPFRRLLRETGPRMQMEADAPRTEIRLPFGILQADVAEESGQQRLVDRAVARRIDRRRQLRIPFPALLRHLARELRMHVAPLGQPKKGDEAGAAGIDEAAMRKLLGEPRAEKFPQREKRQEIGALVAEEEMRFVGGLLLRKRPVARIGHRQRARDHKHLGKAAARRAPPAPCVPRADRPGAARARVRAASECAPRRPRRAPAAADSRRRSRAAMAPRGKERRRPPTIPAPPCAGSRPRATSAGSRGRCTAAARRSRPRHKGARRSPRRGGRSARRADSLPPARSFPPAAASSCCAANSASFARGRSRSRSGCPAPSMTSRRRWLRARSAGRSTARRRAAARPRSVARTAAVSRGTTHTGGAQAPSRSSAAVSRISRSPGRNTRMSPGPSRQSSSAAATIASSSSSSSSASSPAVVSGRYRTSTGKTRPETSMTGAGRSGVPKWRAKRSASSVAEVTITLRSGRRGRSSFR